MLCQFGTTGGGVRACVADWFLAAAPAFKRACRPALLLAAGGPKRLRTRFYLLPPVGLSSADT